MSLIAAEVFRDFETEGVPSSGPHKPKKSEIRTLLKQYEVIISAFTASGGLIYISKAALDADLAHGANSSAWVIGDSVVANNGVYRKIGASGTGSWSRVADLPYSFIAAEDDGDGTPNAIQATSAIPISGSALVLLNVYDTNTGSPVTVSFNGEPPLTIKSNSGNDIAPGGLPSGMLIIGRTTGSEFRLVSDQASAALLAQMEDLLGDFTSRYPGAFANDADATAALGGSPVEGAEYWNSTSGTRRVWHSGAWVSQSIAINDGDITETKLSPSLAVPRVFPTFAAAQAFTPLFTPDFITTAGYVMPGDLGGARYKLVATEPPHAGKLSITVLGIGVKWYELAEASVTPQMFGAIADATNIGVGTDATAAIEACLAYWKTHNVEMALYGSYRYNPTGAWNLTGVNRGARIRGRSKNLDGFFLDTGKGLAIEGDNNFYLHLEEFRIFANTAGPAVRIGKNDFSDAFNGCRAVLTINNNSLDAGCSGLCLNYVLASDFFCTINCGGTGRPTLEGGGANPNAPGKGKVLWLRQACFNRFMVAAGQGNIGICIETGFSFANQFDAIDVEEVGVGVAVFSPSAARNLFNSGQYVGSTVINCADGNATVFGKACNLSPYAGGVVFSGRVGLEIETGGRQNHLTNPAMPASGATVQNSTASKVLVHIWAGNVSNIVITSKDGGAVSINPQVVGEGNDLVLHPNWSVTLTYTVAPSWRWFPL